ncbi:MAG: hypothetical protein JWR85_2010 [Marmoricola sp.]|nr:hypothetical protein [Marmoricola sp.]
MSTPVWRLAVLSTVLLTLPAAPALADSAGTTPAQISRVRTSPTGDGASLHRGTGDPRTPVLPRRIRGRAAVQALGTHLAGVAQSNGLSSARLTSLLRNDHTAWVSREGQVYFQEDAPEASTSATPAAATVAPAYPTSQTFLLHSRPGATRKIYLDFNGAAVQNTDWNGTGPGEIANGTHIGFDTDGSPSTFSTSEHGFVQEVWRQVAETYSAFDVDVTTKDPGSAGIRRTSTSDTSYGTQVLITSAPTPRQQVCGDCLGVAFLSTYGDVDPTGYHQPAWVFAYNTRFDPMVVAQAAAHETGHNLGLEHDGVTGAEYYGGTEAWGPIMGSSRSRAISQFSKGEYAGADNTLDDFEVIQSNGLPLRADDHGSSVTSADQLGSSPSYDVRGIIGTRTDTDVFAITLSCLSNLTVAATGIGAQTTLDLKLEVLNAAGVPVVTSSPASNRTSASPPVSTGMNAQASVSSAVGLYYLRVDGVGYGNPAGPGWSDYGSIGQYHLTATGCPDLPLPTPTRTPSPTPNPTPTPSPTPKPTPAPEPKPTASPKPAPVAKRPPAPRIAVASSGARRGAKTAVARWYPPASTGGAAITRYRVVALRLNRHNQVIRSYGSSYLRPTVRALTVRLPRGRYVFKVVAFNRVGASPWSGASRVVKAR